MKSLKYNLYQIYFFLLRILPARVILHVYKKGKISISKIAEVKRWSYDKAWEKTAEVGHYLLD